MAERPELALMSESMREAVRALAERCTVAVVSGRDRRDVERLVGLDSLVYAGSHGFDIAGHGFPLGPEAEVVFQRELERATEELGKRTAGIEGVSVEPKRYAVAVHYPIVSEQSRRKTKEVVEAVAALYPELQLGEGKGVYEFRPGVDWDKGRAVLWLLEALGHNRPDVLPIYLGDDLTDEDAFQVLQGRGLGIVVGDLEGRPTRAQYSLSSCTEVEQFLRKLTAALRTG